MNFQKQLSGCSLVQKMNKTMKIKKINSLEKFTGTILIPVFETTAKSIVPIEYHGVTVYSQVFYGKKDTHYLVEKSDCTHVFIGLGKELDYKALKTVFRRITSKQKEVFAKNVKIGRAHV